MALRPVPRRNPVLDRFLDHCHRRTYPAKSVIINAGDHSSELYYLTSGSVSVVIEDDDGHEIILAYLNAGDFFGESALLHGTPRNATARAATPCSLYELNRKDLDKLFSLYPDIRETVEAVDRERLSSNTVTGYHADTES